MTRISGGSHYTNPVFEHDAPDPSIIQAEDGNYYAYTTASGYWPGVAFNTPILRSRDLVNWEHVGDAFSDKPSWVRQDMWAPHISKTGDHYTLLFSGRDAEGKMKIGYAISANPTGPFWDMGILVNSGSWGYDIDPYLLQTNGRTFLFWGSGPEGISGQEVAIGRNGGIRRLGSPRIVLRGDQSDPKERLLVEGSWVHERGGKYYMFYSAGSYKSDYEVKVARSDSPLGPFHHRDAPPVMRGRPGFRAPGHNSIITDAAGQDWMLYHSWMRDRPEWGRSLFLDKIEWEDGWPVVNGGHPSARPQTAPITDALEGARRG